MNRQRDRQYSSSYGPIHVVAPSIAAVMTVFFVAWYASLTAQEVAVALTLVVLATVAGGLVLWVMPVIRKRAGLASMTQAPVRVRAAERGREFDPARLGAVPKATLRVWRHYETIAMHFNDLIMRWRLQAIGGLAALITASGFVVGAADDFGVRYRAMCFLSAALLFAWIGVAVIDLLYYRKLLAGAVEALLRVERRLPDIQLSTTIERHAYRGGLWAPRLFYAMGVMPLVFFMGWAAYNLIVGPAPE